MSDAATLDILIRIREEIAGLRATTAEIKRAKEASDGFGASLKAGFGIDIARRAMDFARDSLRALTDRMKQAADEAMRMAGEIKDGAEALRMSTDAYQVFGNVLRDAGGDIGMLTIAVNTSNRALVEARDASSAAAASFRRLGLDAIALDQLPVERRMEALARAIMDATDQNQAFSDASRIVGSRNLPILLNALRDVAGGYDKLAAAQKAAGLVMDETTVALLDRNSKRWERFWKSIVIATGERVLGPGFNAAELAMKDPAAAAAKPGEYVYNNPGAAAKSAGLGLLVPAVGAFDFLSRAFAPKPEKIEPKATDPAVKAHLEEQAELVGKRAKAELALAAAVMERQTIEARPTDEAIKRPELLEALRKEAKLRAEILDVTKRIDPQDNETDAQKDLRIKALQEELKRLRDEIAGRETDAILERKGWTGTAKREFNNFRQRQQQEDRDGIGITAGAVAGAQDFVTNLGTRAQQAASVMQGTLGSAVSAISDGIYGWITGTMTFGQALKQIAISFGQSMVQAFAQMVANYAVSKAAMFAIDVATNAKSLALSLASAAKSLVAWIPSAIAASISSFGVAAAIGAAAVVAALAIGGFAKGGYTADGGRDEPAGIVHAGEWVAPKWMVDHPVYGQQIAAMEATRAGAPGYKTGGWVFDFGKHIRWNPLDWLNPKKAFLTTGQKEVNRFFGIGGGRGTGTRWETDSSAAAESARAAMGSLGAGSESSVPAPVSGGISAGDSLAAAAAAGGSGSGSRSAFDGEALADRITVISVRGDDEAQAIATVRRARGEIVRIVNEDLIRS